MDSKGMHIRDQVVMDQALADSLAKGPAGPRYVAAREIVFGTSAVEIVGRDLIFVADTIKRGGDAPFVVRARPLPPKIRVPGKPEPEPTGEAGKKGSPGQRVEIYCRHFEGVRIQSIGSAGGTGGKGVTGSKAIVACSHLPKQGNSGPKLECEEPTPDPTGKRGGPGGPGGDGGAVVLQFVTKSSDGALQGLGGEGGRGGEGGLGGQILQRISDEHGNVTTRDPHQRGKEGSQGATGKSGNPVPAVLSALPENTLWNNIKALAGGTLDLQWAQHRFKQGEYLFRSYRPEGQAAGNLGLARQEFDAVIRAWPGSNVDQSEDPFDLSPLQLTDLAHKLRRFILENQNVYGMSRNLMLFRMWITSWRI